MTKRWHDIAAEAWRTLQMGGGSSDLSIATLPLSLDTGFGPVRMAMGESGEPRLLIPTDFGRRLPDDLSGPGVRLRSVHLVVGHSTRPFIELSCGSRNLDDVFRALTDDILRRLEQGMGPEPAVAQAIVEFRELMSRDPSTSLEMLTGLVGELSLLEMLLTLNPAAASSWTGPLGQRYDFRAARQCAEVKSTLRRTGTVIRVHGLEQLRMPGDGVPLAVVHIVIERTGTGGRSIRSVLEDVYRRSSTPEVLDRALSSVGLGDWRTRDALGTEKFQVLQRNFYHIGPGFPCLTAESFRPGQPGPAVQEISYLLDLAHAEPYRVAEADIPSILQRLAIPS